jgi:hypothetical protein
MTKTRFGFLNEPSALKWSGGGIEPLADHTRTVNCIRLHERVYGEWVYHTQRLVLATWDQLQNGELH